MQASTPATNASRTTRSTWALAASMTWSWASLKTANASASGSAARRSRRARVSTRCCSRSSNSAQLPAAVEHGVLRVASGRGGHETLDEAACGGALDDRAGELPGAEADHAQRVEVAEGVAVVGEQPLGHELQQHGVVALEGREHVGVGLQRRQPVDREVAGAAAGLAAHLDGGRRVGRGDCLDPGGPRLELALGVLVRRRRRWTARRAWRRPARSGRTAARRTSPGPAAACAGGPGSRAAGPPRRRARRTGGGGRHT